MVKSAMPSTTGPDIDLNNSQTTALLIIYWVDAGILSMILFFCFYIILAFLCTRNEKRLGFIYIFYAYAVILCSLRLAQSSLVIFNKGYMLQDYQPDDLTVVNVLNSACDDLTFVFGCVIVYNTVVLQQNLSLIPSVDPEEPRRKRKQMITTTAVMTVILVACSTVTLVCDLRYVVIKIVLWGTIGTLFVALAILYLVMYCALRQTLEENVFNELDRERKKMRQQFYLFGFSYICKGASYGVEGWLWTKYSRDHDVDNLFIIYTITACLIIFADALPILYISCVHNSTFQAIRQIKRANASQAALSPKLDEANATFLGESKFLMAEESDGKISPNDPNLIDSKFLNGSENDETIHFYQRRDKNYGKQDSMKKSKETAIRGAMVKSDHSYEKAQFSDHSRETERFHYMKDPNIMNQGPNRQATAATKGTKEQQYNQQYDINRTIVAPGGFAQSGARANQQSQASRARNHGASSNGTHEQMQVPPRQNSRAERFSGNRGVLESTFNENSMFMMSRCFNYENTFDISVDDLGNQAKKRPRKFFSSRGNTPA